MDAIIYLIYIIVFLYSVVLHEIAHGYIAYRFGDYTAKDLGRLSPNPIVHIDPVGSLLVPALLFMSQSGFLFGWAKPVPVNPYNLKGKNAYRYVTLGGIATNLVLAIISVLVIKITTQNLGFTFDNLGVQFFVIAMQINLILAIFNLIPFPGFDGYNFLTSFSPVADFVSRTPLGNPMFMARYGLIISIFMLFLFFPFIGRILSFVFIYFLSFFGIPLGAL